MEVAFQLYSFHWSRIASNVDSVVENIEKAIKQNANVCTTKDARQKR